MVSFLFTNVKYFLEEKKIQKNSICNLLKKIKLNHTDRVVYKENQEFKIEQINNKESIKIE